MAAFFTKKRNFGFGTIMRGTTIRQRGFFQVSEEIKEAIEYKKPVVALETTIYTHGFPYPNNVALATKLEDLIRQNGAIPATIGVLNGIARIGFKKEELNELTSSAGNPETKKLSRRDLGYICGLGLSGQKLNGGTTIAGTMVLAKLAGIKIFATGGLGGVHRGGELSLDISADLTELGRTPVTVISSGCKSFLDIPRTLEFLETQGVCVGTFSDGRDGNVEFPAFWTRESGVKSPLTIKDEKEAAAIIYAQSSLGLQSGIHFANPISEMHSIAKDKIDAVIAKALEEAEILGITGSDSTPFILSKIRELTHGDTITANKSLVEENVIRGAKVAVELAKLDSTIPYQALHIPTFPPGEEAETPFLKNNFSLGKPEAPSVINHVDAIVAGAVAIDLSCDYSPYADAPISIDPQLYTSNPANITRSLGGVGRNVATTLHYLGTSVRLCSMIADDVAGSAVIEMLSSQGLATEGVEKIKGGPCTAQYVAVNNSQKDLFLAMADMNILEAKTDFNTRWQPHIDICKPKWLIVDANWEGDILHKWITAGKASGAKIAYEPVSAAKSKRLFAPKSKSENVLGILPNQALSLATPNSLELDSMYLAAQQEGFFEREVWKKSIDSIGMSGLESHAKLIAIADASMLELGLIQRSVQLLPFIRSIVTKLGYKGVLVTLLLPKNDYRLRSPPFAPYILGCLNQNTEIGGVYVRHFPPAEDVPLNQVVSVNGVGDTFIGGLISGLVNGRSLEASVNIAQRGSVLTLKSREAVAPSISTLISSNVQEQST